MSKPKIYAGIFALTIAGTALFFGYLAEQPDRELHFSREVPSELSPQILGKDISALSNWPNWFYSLKDAEMIDFLGRPYPLRDQAVLRGAVIKFWMEPKDKQWKRYELMVSVLEYEPDKRITLRVIKDSTGRLTRIFDRVDWTIELVPNQTGTLIRGFGIAHTSSWRSRLLGTLAEKIVLNQAFLPDLQKLATLDHPLSPNPYPQSEQ